MYSVVRAAYEDVFYCELAQRAIEEWTTNDVWRPAYEQSVSCILSLIGLSIFFL